MNRRGSISVYFALIFAVMVSLALSLILSAKASAGRMMAANSADQAMFSLFAHYDRDLCNYYDLFFLHAGRGSGAPALDACMREIKENAEDVLHPESALSITGKNPFDLEYLNGYVTGYSVATDAGGALFESQAIQAAKDRALIDAVSLIRTRMEENSSSESRGRALLTQSESSSYADIQKKAKEAKEAAANAETGTESGAAGDDASPAASEGAETEVPDGFVNPLPLLEKLKKASVLDLVVPEGREVSDVSVYAAELVSGRSLESGIGIVDATGSSGGTSPLFLAWTLAHFKDFTDPLEESSLHLQLEYLLYGKMSDRDNLKAAVRALLLAREAANIACLYTDPQMSLSLSETAAIISATLLIPEAEPAVKLLLAAGWAYAESIVDVKGLLEGKKVQLVKNADCWQTDLQSFAESGGSLEGLTVDMPGGLTYREYLAGILLTKTGNKLVKRSMDLVELHMKGLDKQNFRLDTCLCSLSVEIRIRSEDVVTFPVEMTLDYRDL